MNLVDTLPRNAMGKVQKKLLPGIAEGPGQQPVRGAVKVSDAAGGAASLRRR